MKNTSLRQPAAGGILTAVALILAIGSTGCNIKQTASGDTKTVLRATRDILKGSQIVDEDVEMWERPSKEKTPTGAYVNRPEVILVDRWAVVDIPMNTIILDKHITTTKPVPKTQIERWNQ